MNKYKIVALFLAASLIATLVHLVAIHSENKDMKQSNQSTAKVVLQTILSRKSVRSFTDAPVTREQLDTLIRAAMAAPSGRDMRPWRFVVITERTTLDTLAARLPYAKMTSEAAAAIVVCGDLSVTGKDGKPSGNWTFDCSAATQNILLMVEAMGLGAVWTGVHPYPDRIQAVHETLELPDNLVPLNLIPIGHPKGETKPKDKFDTANIIYK